MMRVTSFAVAIFLCLPLNAWSQTCQEADFNEAIHALEVRRVQAERAAEDHSEYYQVFKDDRTSERSEAMVASGIPALAVMQVGGMIASMGLGTSTTVELALNAAPVTAIAGLVSAGVTRFLTRLGHGSESKSADVMQSARIPYTSPEQLRAVAIEEANAIHSYHRERRNHANQKDSEISDNGLVRFVMMGWNGYREADVWTDNSHTTILLYRLEESVLAKRIEQLHQACTLGERSGAVAVLDYEKAADEILEDMRDRSLWSHTKNITGRSWRAVSSLVSKGISNGSTGAAYDGSQERIPGATQGH